MKSVFIKFRSRVNAFVKDVSGASLIEYAVLLGVVLAVSVGAILIIGNKVNNTFNYVQNTLNSTYK